MAITKRHLQLFIQVLTLCVFTFFCVSASLGVTSEISENNFSQQGLYQHLVNQPNLSVDEKVDRIVSALTLSEKISLVHASGKFHINAIPRVGIPEMWLSDGPHGVRHQIERHSWESANWTDDHATYLPHLTSVAASWDLEMATLHGTILGREARDRKKDFILGPGVNLGRLPLYGRNFEYMGEDPILAAKLVVPEIKAIQAQDVAATVKHYALNTQELNREKVNAKPDERTLREVYLPAFEAAVKEGNVYGVMGAYNQYFGTNANQSEHLVKDILKGEWGFKGVLLTDWHVDINTFDAAMNGLDLEMGTKVESYDDYFLAKPFLTLIENGDISEEVLNEKVRRILGVQFNINMKNPERNKGERNTLEHQQKAKKIASSGIVLLKNDPNILSDTPLLPLNPQKIKKILVMGPNANKKHGTGGGSSEVKSLYEITPLAGLQKALAKTAIEITYMRAKRDELMPIPNDYVTSRHWTGTPAWETFYYATESRAQLLKSSWLVDARYNSSIEKNNNEDRFITMKGQVKPLSEGEHTFKINVQGKVELILNGEVLLRENSVTPKIFTKTVLMQPHQRYDIEIRYDGKDSFTLGWDDPSNLFSLEKEYLSAAKEADVVIYYGGLSHSDDRESLDRINMKLPFNQDSTITKLLAENSKTVVFLVAGSAVEMPWVDKAHTIVWGWYGGMEAGNAFADMLFGKTNPSGKLPITLPKKLADTAPIALDDYNAKESLYKEGVFIGYRWFEQQKVTPLFPFGHGLSYTTFSLSDIQLSDTKLSANNRTSEFEKSLEVSVNVTNTGKVYGAEVVQLYLHDKKSSVERPYKELKSFAKVFLSPGESKRVTMKLTQRDLSFWDVNTNNWLAEPGTFTVLVGTSSQNLTLRKDFIYHTNVK